MVFGLIWLRTTSNAAFKFNRKLRLIKILRNLKTFGTKRIERRLERSFSEDMNSKSNLRKKLGFTKIIEKSVFLKDELLLYKETELELIQIFKRSQSFMMVLNRYF
jgi:hypothetical protein